MKIINLLLILFTLFSCDSKSQEKITKLSLEDQKLIAEAIKDPNFELRSIEKMDSIQNIKNIFYYDGNFSLYRKVISTFNNDKKLETVRGYNSTSNNKEFLTLFNEKKYFYSETSIKIKSNTWRNAKKYGNSTDKITYDEQGRIIEEVSEWKFEDSNYNTIKKNTYRYNVNIANSNATICVEEYQSHMKPASFEICDTYHYENGKITDKKICDSFQYDKKNRLIKKVFVNKNKAPHFEDLYIYDDKNMSMEYQRYRFDHSRFLAVKKQTYYNKRGLITKKINFGFSKNDTFLPKEIFCFFYDKNNKKNMEINLISKTFIEKEPSLP